MRFESEDICHPNISEIYQSHVHQAHQCASTVNTCTMPFHIIGVFRFIRIWHEFLTVFKGWPHRRECYEVIMCDKTEIVFVIKISCRNKFPVKTNTILCLVTHLLLMKKNLEIFISRFF